MTVGLLVLAAGRSERFGADDKLLADCGGRPLLAVTLANLGRVPVARRLAVVSSDAVAVLCRRAGFGVQWVPRGVGQGDSLAAGVRALQGQVARLVVALGDMPRLPPEAVTRLLDLPADQPACAAMGAIPMPPVVFPADWLPRLAGLSGDRGAGALLRDLPAETRLPMPAAWLADVDRPDDLNRITP